MIIQGIVVDDEVAYYSELDEIEDMKNDKEMVLCN